MLAAFFSKLSFPKKLKENFQRVKRFGTRSQHALSVLILVQTVREGYQQVTKVIPIVASKESSLIELKTFALSILDTLRNDVDQDQMSHSV